MNSYVATFYSHFGALTFCESLAAAGIQAKPAPVPRKLSSSCGTCVRFCTDKLTDFVSGDFNEGIEDMEAIYLYDNDTYIIVIEY